LAKTGTNVSSGVPLISTVKGDLLAQYGLAADALRPGDLVVAVDGKPIFTKSEMAASLKSTGRNLLVEGIDESKDFDFGIEVTVKSKLTKLLLGW